MSLSPVRVLAVNSGAASVRFALFESDGGMRRLLGAAFEGIGLALGRATVLAGDGALLMSSDEAIPSHEAAARRMHQWLGREMPGLVLDGIGHRVIPGSSAFTEHRRIDAALMSQLDSIAVSDPGQSERYLKVVRVFNELLPLVPAVACFDTLIHRSMPRVAKMLPLPRELFDQGVMRFGIHGLSCQSILESIAREVGADAAEGRVVIAHFGCTSSMSAFQGGSSVDCTSGYTPGGLVMGTRPGDMGSGALLHLLLSKGLSPAELANMLSFQSGLLGVSKVSRDMKELIKASGTNPNAADAVELFCYSARKHLGAMIAALGGIDTLVFTGGVGLNEPRVRRLVCEKMDFAGIRLDNTRNRQGSPVISAGSSPVTIRLVASDEESVVARAVADQLASS